ncbi:MAG: Gfo/Idh/MocA family oxidoreductase [Erythrobacter sp.]|uniref:Gfo/Idh/MocA family protein n=1 Tax=Erythrobacter sp. TaxID=1042 RepID=UPI00261E51DE|nr:Gfo/Idh/MocA family oxidoreductase [Erythrobacter sp.]MDJ0978406.1 Gfo/Idh/MocA family oxidoreductase [Erythrobacter sp.]
MTATFAAGVIGCGRMGAFPSPSVREYGPACFLPSAHAEAMQMADGVDLVALCDPDAERLARAGEHYGAQRRYKDARALLEAGAPDVLGVATRTLGRADIILDAIASGTRALHVEKPLCNSMAELERLGPVLEREDVFVTLGAVRRHFAVYQHALAQAQSGQYGRLLFAHAEFGARTLYWSHPHSVDLLLFAGGGARVEAVQARLGSVEREGSTITNDPLVLEASVWFDTGFSGHITRMPGTDWRLACETSQLAVVANGSSIWRSGRPKIADDRSSTNPAGANPYHEPERLDFAPPAKPEGALAPIRQLIACLRGDAQAIAANAAVKRDIVTGQRVLFAMVQSHLEGGRPVALDDVDRALAIEGRTGGAPA